METVKLSPRTVEMLQSVAIPLKDDFDTVIQRLVECAQSGVVYTNQWMSPAAVAPAQHSGGVGVAPQHYYDLRHTRLQSAEFANVPIEPANWNQLSRTAHAIAFKTIGSVEELSRVSSANIEPGVLTEKGYEYIPEGDFSLQGLSAALCWNAVVALAARTGVTVKAEFRWHDKPEAQFPGEVRSIAYPADAAG